MAPFISSIVNWFRGKPGDQWWYRMWSNRRAEKLVEKHGPDRAAEIVRLGMAMCADKPDAQALLPKPRQPLDDAIEPRVVIIESDWRNAPTRELPAIPRDPPPPHQLPAA